MVSKPVAQDFLNLALPGLLKHDFNEVYIDLDGVLADFDNKVLHIFNGKRPAEIGTFEWGVIKASHPNLYFELDLMPSATLLVESFKALEITPTILTAIPKRIHWPEAVKHKRDWVEKHFGKSLDVRFGPFAVDKQYYCKFMDVLIDDMEININQWVNRGGMGFIYRDPLSEK